MTDIGQAQQLINNGVINVCIDAVSGTAALIVLCTISWKLTLLIVAVLPFYGFLYRSINPKIRQASHDVQEQTSVISGTAIERLNAIAVVQSFAQEHNEALYFSGQADELRERTVRHGRLNVTLQSISELLVTLGSTSVWLVGGWMAVAGKITAGEIVEFTAVAALLYMPIRRFSEANIILQSSLAAIQRVFNVFDIVPAVRDKPGLPDRSPTHGALAFEHVSFGYPKGLPVLHDVTFEIAAGERIAVVGESGAGKSTLATLIPRLFDVTAGRILIDGIDVRDYPHRRLRRSIGIVLQESILFTGTIREEAGAQPEAFDEIWHLVKPRQGGSGWLLAGIQQMQ